MVIGTLKEIICYPIKSTSGMVLDTCDVETRGLKGDRKFAIYDTNGKIASGKNTRRFFRLNNIIDLRVVSTSSNLCVISEVGIEYVVPCEALDRYLSELLGVDLQVKAESHVSHMDDGQVHLITTADLESLS